MVIDIFIDHHKLYNIKAKEDVHTHSVYCCFSGFPLFSCLWGICKQMREDEHTSKYTMYKWEGVILTL